MRRFQRYALIALAFTAIASLSWQVSFSQGEELAYFSETGHSVQGAFLTYYQSVANPEVIFGYPITEAFNSGGLIVQYFQRARFEQRPDGSVSQTPIGSMLYEPGRPHSNFSSNPAACSMYATGFQVCGSFLDFYNLHGGAAQFGQPLSTVETDGLRHVQYFEYGRLEWYPDSADPRLEVQLGPLGQLLFERQKEDPRRLRSLPLPGIIEVTNLQLHVFPEIALVTPGKNQSVFVIAQDQTFAPISGTEVLISVFYPSEKALFFSGRTNEHGFIEVPLDPADLALENGKVLVEVETISGRFGRTTSTSFHIAP